MNLINLIISIIITVLTIAVFPSIIYGFLKDKKYQKDTFWKFIFSKNFLLPFIFGITIGLIHGALDWVLGRFSSIFNFKYTAVSESSFGRSIFGFYLVLSYIIFIIVASLYYSSLSKKDKISN